MTISICVDLCGCAGVNGPRWVTCGKTQDLLYTEIQTPLFAYLLPFCVEAWREDLRGIRSEYGGFVEYIYLVLANRQVLDKHLTPKESTAVSEFMRQTILEEIDDQRGLAFQGMNARPYRWMSALTTYGVLRPDLDRLWTDWWRLGTVGRAIAALQYISCLIAALAHRVEGPANERISAGNAGGRGKSVGGIAPTRASFGFLEG